MFFKWSVEAVSRYYTAGQREMHRELLHAVRNESTQPLGDEKDEEGVRGSLEQFAHCWAGRPLLYGVCLQVGV